MNPVNQTTYYIEEKGWFTTSLKPVSRVAFKAHQAAKRSETFSHNRTIHALAMGILAVTQSMRVPMGGPVSGAQVALPALCLHLWSQIPTASAAATTLIPTPTTAPPGPQGDEFQVNTYIADDQANPSVAALAGGGFVITWQSNLQDGSNHGVYGQLFNGMGARVGSEFPINTYTTNYQGISCVATLAEGGFAVTWHSFPQDGSANGVYGQRFDGVGEKVGGEFQVNTYTTNKQQYSSVAALTAGGFVVTWDGQDGSNDGVYGQRFDGTGRKLESEFLINVYTLDFQEQPDVAALTDGGFVITWQSNGQDGSGKGVYGRIFAGNSISKVQPTITNKSSSGLTMSTSQTQDSASSQAQKTPSTVLPKTPGRSSASLTTSTSQTTFPESGKEQNTSRGIPESFDVTEPERVHTSPLSLQKSGTGTGHMSSSDQAPSQTPLFAGVAAGVAALAYSLLTGGLFFWRRKRAEGETDRAVQLETGNLAPNADAGQSSPSGDYQILPNARSHYKEWPKEAPTDEGKHYHKNIEVLNQQMAQEYGNVSSPQQGAYDIITTSQYRDSPLDPLKEMESTRE